MRSKILLRFIIFAALALVALLFLRSSSVKEPPATGESMEDCCQKKCKLPEDNNLIWESFPRQFISIAN
jgi:hypothetical protein